MGLNIHLGDILFYSNIIYLKLLITEIIWLNNLWTPHEYVCLVYIVEKIIIFKYENNQDLYWFVLFHVKADWFLK